MIANSPAAFYRLDEGSGSIAYDSSGNGNNLTYYGSPTFGMSGPLATDGASAVTFDGSTSNAEGSFEEAGTDAYTVEAWFKTTYSGSHVQIIGNQEDYSTGLDLEVGTSGGGFGSDGDVVFSLHQHGVDIGVYTNQNYDDGQWHYAVGVWQRSSGDTSLDTSQLKLYIDGQMVSETHYETTSSATASALDSPIGIGGTQEWTPGLFPGSIADVAFYDSALSAGDVATHYYAAACSGSGSYTPPSNGYTSAVLSESPEAFYPLDETDGCTAHDVSGNGNDLLYRGTPTYGVTGPLTTASDSAVTFDGSTSNADGSFQEDGTDAYTVEAWFKTTYSGSHVQIIGNQDDDSTALDLEVGTSGGGYGSDGDVVLSLHQHNVDVGVYTNQAYDDGQWHYAVGVWQRSSGDTSLDTSQLTLYIDGQLVSETHYENTSTAAASALDSIIGIGGTQTLPAGYFPGSIADVAFYDSALSSSTIEDQYNAAGYQALAEAYMPMLNFSSEEKWRPLNVDAFFSDDFGSSGIYGPHNQICDASSDCTAITSASQLDDYASADDYIEFDNVAAPGDESEPDDYESPHSSCISGVLLDCDSGPDSSIYYTVVGPSPDGYTYIEYWFFYRYNQGYEDLGNHVGDWEGVTVVPTTDGQAIAYVEFSEHGDWYSYLVSGLTCNGGLACSVDGLENANTNIDDFPASGSHANYPAANSGPSTDGNTDGAAPWGNNLVESALLPMPAATPTASEDWSAGDGWADWPGAWGDTPQSTINPLNTGSPCGPAAESGVAADGSCGPDHATHDFEPWGDSDNNSVCGGTTGYGPCPDVRGHKQTSASANCGSWAGHGVAASVCEPQVLAKAITNAKFNSERASFRVWIKGSKKVAASVPGLAQLIGAPLHPGKTLVIDGKVLRGAQVSVEAERGDRVIQAAVTVTRTFDGRAALTVRPLSRGRLTVIVTRRRKDLGRIVIKGVPPGS